MSCARLSSHVRRGRRSGMPPNLVAKGGAGAMSAIVRLGGAIIVAAALMLTAAMLAAIPAPANPINPPPQSFCDRAYA
jgi:hypothetical protein